MKRLLIARLFVPAVVLGALLLPHQASARQEGTDKDAQQGGGGTGAEGGEGAEGMPEAPAQPPPPSDEALSAKSTDTSPAPVDASAHSARTKTRQSWKDIVVLPRKSFLKRRRVEVTPFFATTLNDSLIQHTGIGSELNYYITDILSIGATGMYYFHNVLDQEFFTRYHFQRVPSLNRYRFTATLNMGYTPIYGKFAFLNHYILQYEIFATGGVGISGTEVIPRNQDHEKFSNLVITIPLGLGGRLFINRWLALYFQFRDFMMLDKYEALGRTEPLGEVAKTQAEARFVNNVVVNVGLSFFFPLDFQYTTFR